MRPPKGTYDALPVDLNDQGYCSERLAFIRRAFVEQAEKAGFQEIITPIIEPTELFIKSTGVSSDIVGKEMYTFSDRSDRSITLRPEGTPGTLRALALAKGHEKNTYQKVFYIGPMFRYERPQQGRHRQFIQFGMELLGPKSPMLDVDMIQAASEAFKTLGLEVKLQINTIGTLDERAKYKEALTQVLSSFQDELSEDSQKRLLTNPLRILDSKSESDQKLLEKAPKLRDFLGEDSLRCFSQVQEALTECGISFTHNPHLVRGLDYYSDTVFEWVCDDIGAQSALGGGGRYSGLYHSLGGDGSEGVGFACGLERIYLALESSKRRPKINTKRDFLCIPMGLQTHTPLLKCIFALREKGHLIDLHPISSSKKLAKALQTADKRHFRYAIIAGEKELEKRQILIKDLDTKQQVQLPLDVGAVLQFINAGNQDI